MGEYAERSRIDELFAELGMPEIVGDALTHIEGNVQNELAGSAIPKVELNKSPFKGLIPPSILPKKA